MKGKKERGRDGEPPWGGDQRPVFIPLSCPSSSRSPPFLLSLLPSVVSVAPHERPPCLTRGSGFSRDGGMRVGDSVLCAVGAVGAVGAPEVSDSRLPQHAASIAPTACRRRSCAMCVGLTSLSTLGICRTLRGCNHNATPSHIWAQKGCILGAYAQTAQTKNKQEGRKRLLISTAAQSQAYSATREG